MKQGAGVAIHDSRLPEGVGERALVVLRVATGAGEAADVHECLDAGVAEDRDELLQRPDAVTHREHACIQSPLPW